MRGRSKRPYKEIRRAERRCRPLTREEAHPMFTVITAPSEASARR
ncbi:hypothetical protein [Nocardiopsis alba]